MSDEPEQETATRRKIGPILAKRRTAINDDHITDYKKIVDGDKMDEVAKPHRNPEVNGVEMHDLNLSKLYTSGASTTSNIEVLVLEAQIADENEDYNGNPHIPSRDSAYDAAVKKIEEMGLVPAWEVVDGE